jgi:DNA-binding Lrp family transcriptional regulator
MPVKTTLKSRVLDEKDKKILMVLQENGRASLTEIAKKVRLSIDSIHKRMKEMQRKEIYSAGIFIDPRVIGFPLVADIKIKLRNITEKQKEGLIEHLSNHSRVIELLSVMGDFDLTLVLIAENTDELDKISTEIRQKYSEMIADWRGVLVLKTHKFEYYDLS